VPAQELHQILAWFVNANDFPLPPQCYFKQRSRTAEALRTLRLLKTTLFRLWLNSSEHQTSTFASYTTGFNFQSITTGVYFYISQKQRLSKWLLLCSLGSLQFRIRKLSARAKYILRTYFTPLPESQTLSSYIIAHVHNVDVSLKSECEHQGSQTKIISIEALYLNRTTYFCKKKLQPENTCRVPYYTQLCSRG
jgi:hypothetical protein